MKKIVYFVFLIILSITAVSCSDPEPDIYVGDSLLNFNKGTSTNAFVVSGTGYSDNLISYGTIKPVTGTHQVKLVLDQANSTAVQGVDFQILNSSDELVSGEVGGNFTIRILEAAATQVPKVAVFKLESGSLSKAIFDQTFTMNMSLTCPISGFVGDFTNTQSWWYSPGGVFTVEESTTANQLLVKDFWDAGIDLVLNYNPDTFVVTIPQQNTGYFVSTYNGYIWARPSTDASQVSSFNPCTRVITLYINYYIPNVGSYGNKIEAFTGL